MKVHGLKQLRKKYIIVNILMLNMKIFYNQNIESSVYIDKGGLILLADINGCSEHQHVHENPVLLYNTQAC